MASSLPIPAPPRTPTPPPDEEIHDAASLGLALDGVQTNSPPKLGYNGGGLSPLSANFPTTQYANLAVPGSLNGSPRRTMISPTSSTFPNSPYSSTSVISEYDTPATSTSEAFKNPFNFTPQQYTLGRPPPGKASQDIGRRRGHKYKHSSVSHQIILEPPPRPPLQLPAAIPIPTWKEYWSSRSREQSHRCIWCACHLLVSAFVLWSANECLSLTVLSRLLFFDALGAILCVTVDIGNNFEAWKRSSIRNPFGFERSEVLAGLGMSVGLLFMGFDLISHGLTHALENVGNHESHHAHEHEHPSIASTNIAAFFAIFATLISAMALRNHARIGKVMQIGSLSWLPSILSNPSHLMTLSCSTSLILLSLVTHGHVYEILDRLLSFTLSASMIYLGWQQGWTLGKMLMMSYSGPDVSLVLDELSSDPIVTGIDEAKFWQVHYGLCQANIKLRVKRLDDMVRLRDRVSSLVRNRLGGGYGTGGAGQKWEVSTQITLDAH